MQGHYISITVTAYRSVWVYRNVAFGDVFDSRLDADMRRNANFKVEVAPHPPPPPFITIDTIYDITGTPSSRTETFNLWPPLIACCWST